MMYSNNITDIDLTKCSEALGKLSSLSSLNLNLGGWWQVLNYESIRNRIDEMRHKGEACRAVRKSGDCSKRLLNFMAFMISEEK